MPDGSTHDRFSHNQQLEDVDYNQGCDGGDPMLEARWLQEFAGYTERCYNSLARIDDAAERDRHLQTHPDCKHQLQVTNYRYCFFVLGAVFLRLRV